jgi:hypothetical protein
MAKSCVFFLGIILTEVLYVKYMILYMKGGGDLWCSKPLNNILVCIMVVSFIGGGNLRKSLTNFIT